MPKLDILKELTLSHVDVSKTVFLVITASVITKFNEWFGN